MAYRASQISMIRNVSPIAAPSSPPSIPFIMECTTPTLDAQMWVSESVKYTQSYDNVGDPSGSALPRYLPFRAFWDGQMSSFDHVRTSTSNVSWPGNSITNVWAAGANATEALGLPVGGLMVKVPNCHCTSLASFKMRNSSGATSINVRTIEFSDGYKLDGTGGSNALFLGPKIMMLSSREAPDHKSSIPSFRTVDELEPGDFVLKCTNTEATMRTGTDCVTVVATGSATLTNMNYVHSIQTGWPQNTWANSTVRGIMMLENGVYICTNPAGGNY